MSVRPVVGLMGRVAFIPSNETVRSSVPQTFANASGISG